jgi:LuxR family maltose regulon positive regulatory protein
LLQTSPPEPADPVPPGPAFTLIEPLSTQELRVLRLLEAGLSRQEIARELSISENTVKTHLYHIYQKLNVTNRDDAIEAARQFKRG